MDKSMRQTQKLTFITQMIIDNIVMWDTRLSFVDCLFQDSDFAGDLEDSQSISGESYASSEVEHLFPQVGCAKSKHRCLTVQLNLKLFLWMLVCEWMVCLPWNYGI